ncbi:alpha/beta hydrolase [Bradyrhizobium sp.]|uniref:alpha/beta fold hydrolase n=1 Tax=Bradyrhizobium sp. TaxID=376 RepID=UPI002E077110|nr:alpha/beta hydrolase [Bradyrhizobium sp.]
MPDPTPLKTNDGRFSYEAKGARDLPPLAFLHGIGGGARVWRGQLDAFSDRYRAIAWDMPGYGGSAPLQSVSIPALAGALKDFLLEVGAVKPILVGHSIGGMIVQQLLAHDPMIAEYVVLAQTSPAFGRSDGDWQKEFLEARLGPLDRGETMASLAPRVVADLIGDHADPAGIELACACMASVPEASYRAAMMSMLGFDLRKSLGQICVPTLVIAGAKDKNAPAPMVKKMASFIRNATYVELEGVGHLVALEQPREFNAVLDDFLRMASPATGSDA